MKKIILSVLFVASLSLSGTTQNVPQIKISNQTWMLQNLNMDKFRNGDPIPQAKTTQEWVKAGDNKQPAWCYYSNDPANGAKYGKLYNWYAVNDPRGLAPSGWHIPSDAEWSQLTNYLGGISVAGKKMKSNIGWEDEDNGNGTNESGFSALPGGNRDGLGSFWSLGLSSSWWSSTEKDTDFAWSIHILDILYNYGKVDRDDYGKCKGLSVRCVKDN
jgi:uncharacterized protein (TIGR02145 family)